MAWVVVKTEPNLLCIMRPSWVQSLLSWEMGFLFALCQPREESKERGGEKGFKKVSMRPREGLREPHLIPCAFERAW